MNMNHIDEEIVIIFLLAEEEEEENKAKRRKQRLWVHNINAKRLLYGEYHTLYPDLLEDEIKFFQYFRMSREKFENLVEILKPRIKRQNTTFRKAIGPQERLAVCLRFLATGNYRSLAFFFRMGERTVREIVYSTCEAIWKLLRPIVMPTPDEQMWVTLENDFRQKWNFPNAVAAIDGKHVMIQAPPHSGSNFFCYKKHFSTVLLALVDANYKFIVIDVGAYGKNSDASIFRNSPLGMRLRDGTIHMPPPKQLPGSNITLPHVLVGDEAFPLCTYLMRPYSRDDVQGNEEKKIFNYRLSRARNTVENTFGILSKKFRIFERKLCVSHEHVISVVTAVCCLHNFLRHDTCHWTESDLQISLSDMRGLQNLRGTGGLSRRDALEIRDNFKDFFNSEAGSVDWQQNVVRAGRRLL